MDELLIVTENLEDNYVVGVEQGARYVLTGPDGRRAVFNDPTDVDHVGYLNAPPVGFDTPTIRESRDSIAQGDGAVHGPFYLSERAWALSGLIDPIARQPGEAGLLPGDLANLRIDKLKRASRALRSDATLEWTPRRGLPVRLRARLQSLRVADRLPKTFTLSMVSSEPRFLGQLVRSATAAAGVGLTARNRGNERTPPRIILRGAWTSPIITNTQTGEDLRLDANGGLVTGAGDTAVIDVVAKTILVNGTVNRYDRLSFPSSEWWELKPADNALTATGGGVDATWETTWRDAWL